MNDYNYNPAYHAVIGEVDRRTEPRYAASGEVRLWIQAGHRISIPGRLLDISAHGMRIEHMYAELPSGAVIEIEHDGEIRAARVVWNKIKNEGVESGFFLV